MTVAGWAQLGRGRGRGVAGIGGGTEGRGGKDRAWEGEERC